MKKSYTSAFIVTMMTSIFALIYITLPQYLFPEAHSTTGQRIFYPAVLIVILVSITINERSMKKRDTSNKWFIRTVFIRLAFCLCFSWDLNLGANYPWTDRIWLQLPFFLYVSVPLLTFLVFEITALCKVRDTEQKKRSISRIRWMLYGAGMICFFILLPWSIAKPGLIKNQVQKTSPYAVESKNSYFTRMTDLAVQGDCLYVLYGHYDLMEVYSLEGNYLCAYAIRSAKGGLPFLSCDDDTVWLEAKDGRVYQFRDGSFEKKTVFSPDTPRDTVKNAENKRTAPDGTVYQIRGASVVRINDDGTRDPVIKRPLYYIFADERLLIIMFFVLALIPPVIMLPRIIKYSFSKKNPLYGEYHQLGAIRVNHQSGNG